VNRILSIYHPTAKEQYHNAYLKYKVRVQELVEDAQRKNVDIDQIFKDTAKGRAPRNQ
jgi:hypothetical protein